MNAAAGVVWWPRIVLLHVPIGAAEGLSRWKSEKGVCLGSGRVSKPAGSAKAFRRFWGEVMTTYFTQQGDPVQANTFEGDRQKHAQIAARPDGSFAAVWTSFQQDGDREGIVARLFAADGSPLSAEIQVNDFTTGIQQSPNISIASDGSFTIVWQSFGVDDSLYGIAARNFSAAGVPLGEEFVVNTVTSSIQDQVAAARLASGATAATWESFGIDGDSYGIATRLVLPNDVLPVDRIANTTTTYSDVSPAIAATADGGYVVAWEDHRLTATRSTTMDLRAQRFDASSNPVGPEISVNASQGGTQTSVALAGLSGGGFVAVWNSNPGFTDNEKDGVIGQRFDAAGNAVGPEFQISDHASELQANPDVIALADGGFAVAWHSGGVFVSGQNVIPGGHYLQVYDAAGAPQSGNTLITDDTGSTNLSIDLAQLASGDLVASFTSAQGDADGADILIQRLAATGTFDGTEMGERLDGDIGPDSLNGFGGDDTIDGGPGADLMIGGQGSDVIYVDHVGDRVAESRKWAGSDTVISSVDFRMGRKHIEDLELTGDAVLGAGNGLKNRITGNDANNILDGGKNVDTLIGGLGDDRYLVRAPGDNVVEAAGEGTDTILAFRAYALDAHVENLYLQTLRNAAGDGVAGVNGIGNDLSNTIVGNPFDNVITGRLGGDTLRGQAGADTFVFDRAASAQNADRIIDFNTNTANEGDRLMFTSAAYRATPKGALDVDRFVEGTTAQDADDRFIWDQQRGQLWFDVDGSGAAVQQLVARFEQDAVVTVEDIILV